MPENVIEQLAGHGILGAIVVVLGFAYLRLQKQLDKVQDARVEDAQKVAQTLMDVNEKWMARIDALNAAIDKLTSAGPFR